MRIRVLPIVVTLTVAACVEPNPFYETMGSEDSANSSTGSGDAGSQTTPASDTGDGNSSISTSSTTGGLDTSGADGMSDSTSATGSDTSNSCREYQFCTSLPDGWTGFSTITVGDRCPSTFPELLDSGFTSVSAPAAACECECTAPTTCADTGTLAVLFGAECVDAGGPTWDLVADTQVPTGDIQNASGQDRLLLTYEAPGVANCTHQATEEVTRASRVNEQLVCADGGMFQACGGDYCGDTPDAERICIHREGVHPCPDAYPTQTVLYRSINDTRGCTSCSCTDLVGSCAGVGVDFYDGDDTLLYARDADACLGFNGSFAEAYAILDPGVFDGSCTATQTTSTGEATLENPFTVCCASI